MRVYSFGSFKIDFYYWVAGVVSVFEVRTSATSEAKKEEIRKPELEWVVQLWFVEIAVCRVSTSVVGDPGLGFFLIVCSRVCRLGLDLLVWGRMIACNESMMESDVAGMTSVHDANMGISSASIAGSVFMFHDALECIPIKYCLLLWRQLDMRFLVRGCTKELEVLCRLHWSKSEFIIFDSGLTN
ncbi:hypothetical protein Tco_1132119 [Tanacetum coccineum]|uniref:Uncharacterized protein n=1 Tax=Tanacetum coccineum TaxID=301880 RepID=A0ABQ5JE32_9ASTR